MVYALASIGLTVALGPRHGPTSCGRRSAVAFPRRKPRGRLAIMAVGSFRAPGLMLRRYFSGRGARVMATLRTRIADRYRDLSLAFHRETPTGELLAHMEADVEAAVDVLHRSRSRRACSSWSSSR